MKNDPYIRREHRSACKQMLRRLLVWTLTAAMLVVCLTPLATPQTAQASSGGDYLCFALTDANDENSIFSLGYAMEMNSSTGLVFLLNTVDTPPQQAYLTTSSGEGRYSMSFLVNLGYAMVYQVELGSGSHSFLLPKAAAVHGQEVALLAIQDGGSNGLTLNTGSGTLGDLLEETDNEAVIQVNSSLGSSGTVLLAPVLNDKGCVGMVIYDSQDGNLIMWTMFWDHDSFYSGSAGGSGSDDTGGGNPGGNGGDTGGGNSGGNGGDTGGGNSGGNAGGSGGSTGGGSGSTEYVAPPAFDRAVTVLPTIGSNAMKEQMQGWEALQEQQKQKRSMVMTAVAAAVVVVALAVAVVIVLRKRRAEKSKANYGQTEFIRPGGSRPNGPEAAPAPRPAPAPAPRPAPVPMKRYRLVCSGGYLDGRSFPLTGEVSIGRQMGCTIQYPDNYPGVSHRHAVLLVQNGRITLTDHSSTGTLLKRLQATIPKDQPIQVGPGDVFYLGERKNRFEIQEVE